MGIMTEQGSLFSDPRPALLKPCVKWPDMSRFRHNPEFLSCQLYLSFLKCTVWADLSMLLKSEAGREQAVSDNASKQ